MSALELFEIYTNTEEVNIFDHYVPRFLLKYWKVAEQGVDKGQIYRWHRPTDSVTMEGISGVGGDTDWDLSKSKGMPSDFLRKKLFAELLEDKASRVIKLINSSDAPDLTFLEESTLTVFIGHQITRVPAFRLSLSHFFSLGISNGTMKHGDFGDREVLKRKVAKNSINMTYESFLRDTPSIEVDGGKPQIQFLSLDIASDLGEKIYKANLHILEIPKNSSDEFVISDNPVVLLDFERQDLLRFVPWWEIGKKDIWIFMPISPKKAVFYTNGKRKDGPVENDNTSLVELLNFGQYLCCSNEVFAKKEDVLTRHLQIYKSELRKQRLLPLLSEEIRPRTEET